MILCYKVSRSKRLVSGGILIGIILLDTCFPRVLGDIGNPNTFPFPVLYEKVEGAAPARLIRERDSTLLLPFMEAAKALEKRGAKAITTSCGFLSVWQREMASAVSIPLFTSSLVQIPWIYELVGRRGRIGVLTADGDALTMAHLRGVNADRIPVVIEGMDGHGEFYRTYVGNNPDPDFSKIEQEMMDKAFHLKKEHPEVSALVLECTNMAIFRKAFRKAIDLPLFDILTLIRYCYAGLE